MDIFTFSGQDSTKGTSIETFVSRMTDGIIKSACRRLNWAGTPTKAAMKDFEALIAVIIG